MILPQPFVILSHLITGECIAVTNPPLGWPLNRESYRRVYNSGPLTSPSYPDHMPSILHLPSAAYTQISDPLANGPPSILRALISDIFTHRYCRSNFSHSWAEKSKPKWGCSHKKRKLSEKTVIRWSRVIIHRLSTDNCNDFITTYDTTNLKFHDFYDVFWSCAKRF